MFIICLLVVLLVIFKCLKRKYKNNKQIPLPKGKPLMFGRTTCPYTVKMISELKKHNSFKNFTYIDTETKQGSRLMQHYGGNGVPFFVGKNGRVSGFMAKSKLFEKLNM